MILDTNALSAFIDGDDAIGQILRRQSQVALPVIVLGEFRYGITDSRYRAQYEAWLDTHLVHFEVLPVTLATTIPYASVREGIRRRGRPIPANDAWIAALALEHGFPVLSRDKHFDVVQGVQRVSW